MEDLHSFFLGQDSFDRLFEEHGHRDVLVAEQRLGRIVDADTQMGEVLLGLVDGEAGLLGECGEVVHVVAGDDHVGRHRGSVR